MTSGRTTFSGSTAATRAAIERSYRLVRWNELPRGGHFAALEQPELFAADVAAFFATVS